MLQKESKFYEPNTQHSSIQIVKQQTVAKAVKLYFELNY